MSNYWIEFFQFYAEVCKFVGILLVTSGIIYAFVALLAEAWKECFKPSLKKLLKNLALRVYRACK